MAPLWCLTYGTASQCSSLTSQVIDRINQSLWCWKLKAYWSRRRCGLVWILLCRAIPDPYSHCLVANPSIHLLHHSWKLYFFLPLFPIYMYQLSSNKVNRCLARYSPRAATTNWPTNRALNKPAWPGPNWPKMPILGQIWSFLGKKSFFFTGEIKSFVTHITENQPRHLVHIGFWSGIGQNVQ